MCGDKTGSCCGNWGCNLVLERSLLSQASFIFSAFSLDTDLSPPSREAITWAGFYLLSGAQRIFSSGFVLGHSYGSCDTNTCFIGDLLTGSKSGCLGAVLCWFSLLTVLKSCKYHNGVFTTNLSTALRGQGGLLFFSIWNSSIRMKICDCENQHVQAGKGRFSSSLCGWCRSVTGLDPAQLRGRDALPPLLRSAGNSRVLAPSSPAPG